LLKAGRPVARVASDLDVTAQTIYNWRKQELIDTGQTPGVSSTDNAELVAARRRIAELETELAITRRGRGATEGGGAPKSPLRRDRGDG
jgi:transposase-like protein